MLTIADLKKEIESIQKDYPPNKNHADTGLASYARVRMKFLHSCLLTLESTPNLTRVMLIELLASRRQLLAKYEKGVETIKLTHGPKSDYTRGQLSEMNKKYNPPQIREQIKVFEYLLGRET